MANHAMQGGEFTADLQVYAAGFALRASRREGVDCTSLDDEACRNWRLQAISWLEQAIDTWASRAKSGDRRTRQMIEENLRSLLSGREHDSILDPSRISTLPKSEQDRCRRLRSSVGTILEKLETDE